MNTAILLPARRLFVAGFVTLIVAHAAAGADKLGKLDEAVRVRFLIVADTDAKEGAACGLDAKNLEAVLTAGLKKQKLDGRFTIDVLTGRDVSAIRVVSYYRDLKVGPKEALVFYYSGHGAFHATKGHLLTFSQGDLTRARLIAAMQRHRPRLTAVLTDCCAILDNPPVMKPAAPKPGLPGKRFGDAMLGLELARGNPPRPPDYRPPTLEVTAKEAAHPPRPANYRPPPPFDPGVDPHAPAVPGMLQTGDGPLALNAITAAADGEAMRHLFYRHQGLVDISGCQKGKAAYAAMRWGGGLFTISLLSLQKERASKFDTNRNGLVEWSEFFAHLQSSCDRACTTLMKRRIQQLPEATMLAQPSLVVAGR